METLLKLGGVIVALSLLTLSSCEERDFFNKEEEIATRVTDPITSVEGMDQVINGSYWKLIGTFESGWNNPYDNHRIWNSLSSDAFMVTDPPSPRFQNEVGVSYVSLNRLNVHQLYSRIGLAWRGSYSVISAVNLVIELHEESLPGVPFPNDDNLDQLDRVVGEAYFLRAYMYWLLNGICGPAYIPGGDNSRPSIVLKPRNSLGLSEVNVPQSSVEEVYQAMITDLDSAVANLPAYVGLGRAARPAAEALLSRVYLDMNNFAGTEEMATRVIENYDFQLEEEPIRAFNKPNTDESPEVIFEYEWNWSVPKGVQRAGFIGPVPSCNFQWVERRSFGFAGPVDTQLRTSAISHRILQKIGWMENDLSETQSAINDKRYNQVYHRAEPGTDFRMEALTGQVFTDPYVWVFKDCRRELDTDDGMNFSPELYQPYANYPLIRLPEMYLNRAIARLRTGNEAGALQDLNVVRERAWEEDAGPYTPLTSGNLDGAASVEEAIEIERIKELTGEGDRLFYLKAMKMQVDPPTGSMDLPTVPYTSGSLFWPIPLEEVDLNEAIE